MFGNEKTFTEGDLDTMVAKLDPAKQKPPCVVGHPSSDTPAVGWVHAAKRVGGELWVDVQEMNPGFVKQIKDAAYKYVSPWIRPDGSLKHLGFLGGATPAVEGLGELSSYAFAGDDAGSLGFAFGEWQLSSIRRLFQGLRDFMIENKDKETADRFMSQWDIDSIREEDKPYAEPTSEGAPTMMNEQEKAEMEKLRAENAKLTSEKTAAEQTAAQLAFAQTRREDEAFVDSLGAKMPAALKGQAVDLLGALREKGDYAFSEGGSKPAAGVLRDFLSALPNPVSMQPDVTNPGAAVPGSAGAQLNALAEEKVKANAGMAFSEALTKVQMEKPELAQAYALELKGQG